jgi:hypothetical protein
MPYGGLDVSEFVSLEKYDKYILLNNSLIKLLENGIIPMNQKGIYHCDLKDSNILVSFQKKNKFYTRIIDWGLSIYVTNPRILPEFITNRPFQFNVPFSVVLFNSLFYDMYSMFLKNNPEPSYENIKDFVKIYLQKFVGNHGNGHLPVFVSLLKKINFKKNDLNNNNNNNNNIPFFLFELSLFSTKIPDEILIYLTEIIVKYTKNGIFELMDYFSNVFLHNVDIWGFCMVYLAIYDELNNNYDKLIAQEHEILNILNELFYILINTSTEKINVDKVIDKCRHLNKYFNEAYEKSIIKKDIKIQSLLSFYQKRQKTYSFPEENRELIKSLSKDHTKRQFFTPLKNSIRTADDSSSKLPVTDFHSAPRRCADSTSLRNLHWYKSTNKVSKHMYSSKLFNQKNIGKKTRKNNKKHTKHTKKI